MRSPIALLALALTALILAGCQNASIMTVAAEPLEDPALAPRGEAAITYEPGVCALCDLYYNARPSVIRITTDGGLGAGVIVDDRGYALTNAHVVGDAPIVNVETAAGATTVARVVHADDELDLAVLALAPIEQPWDVLAFHPEVEPRVGRDVYVIGHPIGLGWSVSRGIISAYRQPGEVAPIPMIQTDAAISPGNSGGPLVDGEGRTLGIVVSKLAGRGAENIAFVIPGAVARDFADAHIPSGDPPASAPDA